MTTEELKAFIIATDEDAGSVAFDLQGIQSDLVAFGYSPENPFHNAQWVEAIVNRHKAPTE